MKTSENLKQLHAKLSETPNDSYTLYQLGNAYFLASNYPDALIYLQKSFENLTSLDAFYVKDLVIDFGKTLLLTNQKEKALALDSLYSHFSSFADYLYLLGCINFENEEYESAMEHFLNALDCTNHHEKGTNSFKSYYYLGLIQECIGEVDNASKLFKKCGNYEPAKKHLKNLVHLKSLPSNLLLSVCIICKNEEASIEKCLSSFANLPFEIVIVDTGSTDRTLDIASKYTKNIFHFSWCNDFSAPRNFAASKASCNWILSVDCDEYLESIDLEEIKRRMIACPESVGSITLRNQALPNNTEKVYLSQLRRIYHREFYCFSGKVHEQLIATGNHTPSAFSASLTMYHTGYALSDEQIRNKNIRNRELLLNTLQDNPDDAYTLLQLGQTYRILEEYDKALFYFRKGFSHEIDPHLPYTLIMLTNYGNCLLKCELYEEAMFLESFSSTYEQQGDYVYIMGRIYLANNEPLKALLNFVKATTLTEYMEDGVTTYLSNYHIGQIYDAIGNKELAITFLKKCGNYEPAMNALTSLQNQ